MGTFEFKNYDCHMTIAGHEFSVSCTSETGDYMTKAGKQFEELIAGIKIGEASSAHAIEKCKEVTDKLLGTGAFIKIFEGRKPTVTDATDVLLFIAEEIKTFTEQNGNRKQRRKGASRAKG